MLDSVHNKIQILVDAGLSAAPDFMKPRRGFDPSK
jgi:hypothetical protein